MLVVNVVSWCIQFGLIAFVIDDVTAGCPTFRGDTNFTQPNQNNAQDYQKVFQNFKKLTFNTSEFLRCGQITAQYSSTSDDQVDALT